MAFLNSKDHMEMFGIFLLNGYKEHLKRREERFFYVMKIKKNTTTLAFDILTSYIRTMFAEQYWSLIKVILLTLLLNFWPLILAANT